MILINTTEQLCDFCKILSTQPFITVDSEFIREHSYYPKLCLLQVGYDGDAAIIDPLSKVDLSPFFEILQNHDSLLVCEILPAENSDETEIVYAYKAVLL